MQVHTIVTYEDGEHEPVFYVLTEDDYALLHVLMLLDDSPSVDYFEVDMEDGSEFLKSLEDKLYGTNAYKSILVVDEKS
ncbi:MAG: hypothetical protein KKF27_21690 [Gammaproteobacteria bacterium]|nr:hypothetical protein [Gammaproteobacteria bacterium]